MTTTSRKTRIALGTAVAALAIGAAGLAAPEAHAAVPVQQFPANGIISGGISDFGTYSASIRIDTAGPGAVTLSAPGGGQCGHPAVQDSFVRFDYVNVSNGRTGSAMVRPCAGPWSGSQTARLATGPGQVVGATSIVSGGGPWSIPGGATFTVG